MGSVDNIISGVFILMIFLAVGSVIFYNQSKASLDRLSQKRMFYEHENDHNTINTVLLVTDNESGKELGHLIGYSVYKKRLNLSFNGLGIDVKQKLYETLNNVYGRGNYFLNVSPRVYDIALSFVIDGSPSLYAEQQQLAGILDEIVDAAKTGGRKVILRIYLISQASGSCNMYFAPAIAALPSDPNVSVSCKEIDAEGNRGDLYISGVQDYRVDYSFTPPYNYGGSSRTKRPPVDYYEPDWASGAAYALNFINTQSNALTSVVFPMAGELATSSINDSCFVTDYTSLGLDDHDRLFCDLCSLSCDYSSDLTETENRSWEKVKRLIQLARDTNQIVSPIFAYHCNFRAGDALWEDWNYVYGTKTGYKVPSGRSLCSDPNCMACDDLGSISSVCYHKDCEDEVQRQMKEVADQTGGILTDLDNTADLLDAVKVSIQKSLRPFSLTLGKKYGSKDRFVYEKIIPMPIPAEFAYLTLYVYKDPATPAELADLCGNHYVDSGEECDSSDIRDKECSDFGFFYGNVTCDPDCTFSTAECR